MKDSDNPASPAFNWLGCKWVVRVRCIDTGKVFALNYFTDYQFAQTYQEYAVHLYRLKRVCVSLFNRVPLTEV